MTKTKLKQIVIDGIQLFIEENREEIIESIASETFDIDEEGETVPVDQEVIEEVFDSVVDVLF